MPSLADPAELAAWILSDKASASSGQPQTKSQRKRDAAARKKARQATQAAATPSAPTPTVTASAIPSQQEVTSTEEALDGEDQDDDSAGQTFKVRCDFDEDGVLTMIHADGSRSKLSDVVAIHHNVPAYAVSSSEEYDAERAYEWLRWVFYPDSFNDDEGLCALVPLSLDEIVRARGTGQHGDLRVERTVESPTDTASETTPLSKKKRRIERKAEKKKNKKDMVMQSTTLPSSAPQETSPLPFSFGFTQMTPSLMSAPTNSVVLTFDAPTTFDFASTADVPLFGAPAIAVESATSRAGEVQDPRNTEVVQIIKTMEDISTYFQDITATFGDTPGQVLGCALPPSFEEDSEEIRVEAHFERVKSFNALHAHKKKYKAYISAFSADLTAWLIHEQALALNQHRLYRTAEQAQLKLMMCGGPVSVFASAVEVLDTANTFFARRLTEHAHTDLEVPENNTAAQTWEDFMEEASTGFFDREGHFIIAFSDMDVEQFSLKHNVSKPIQQLTVDGSKEFVSTMTVAQINQVLRSEENPVGPKQPQLLARNAMLPLLDEAEITAKIKVTAERERLFRQANIVLNIRVPYGHFPPTSSCEQIIDFETALDAALTDIEHLADIEQQQAIAIILQNATVPIQHENAYAEDYILQLYDCATFDCANSADGPGLIANEPFDSLCTKIDEDEALPVHNYQLPSGFLYLSPEIRGPQVPYTRSAESSCWLSNNPHQKVVGRLNAAVLTTYAIPTQDPEMIYPAPVLPDEAEFESPEVSPSASGNPSRSSSPEHEEQPSGSATPLTEASDTQGALESREPSERSLMSNERYALILAEEVFGNNSLAGNAYPPAVQEEFDMKTAGPTDPVEGGDSEGSEESPDSAVQDSCAGNDEDEGSEKSEEGRDLDLGTHYAKAAKVKIGAYSLLEYIGKINALNAEGHSVSTVVVATAFVQLAKQQHMDLSQGKLDLPVSTKPDKIREILGCKMMKELIRVGKISLHEFLGLLKCDGNGDMTAEAVVDAFMAASRIEINKKLGIEPKKASKVGMFDDVFRKAFA